MHGCRCWLELRLCCRCLDWVKNNAESLTSESSLCDITKGLYFSKEKELKEAKQFKILGSSLTGLLRHIRSFEMWTVFLLIFLKLFSFNWILYFSSSERLLSRDSSKRRADTGLQLHHTPLFPPPPHVLPGPSSASLNIFWCSERCILRHVERW